MKKYFVTVIDLKTHCAQHLVRDSHEDITKVVDKELGGWANLKTAMTSTPYLDDINYQQAGTTKDLTKAFSIICLKDKES